MHSVKCWWVSADEVVTEHGQVSPSQALDLFRSRPWTAENVRANHTGCWPTLSFGAGTEGRDGYLSITGGDRDQSFFIMMETYKDVPFLWIIPWRRSAYLDEDNIEMAAVEQYLSCFFQLTQHQLYQWIVDRGPSRPKRHTGITSPK